MAGCVERRGCSIDEMLSRAADEPRAAETRHDERLFERLDERRAARCARLDSSRRRAVPCGEHMCALRCAQA